MRRKLFKRGRGKVSRKAIYLAITSFIFSLGSAYIALSNPTVTVPTWLLMLPMIIGFLALIYDALIY